MDRMRKKVKRVNIDISTQRWAISYYAVSHLWSVLATSLWKEQKIDYMLQRQIVVKGLGKQIGIEDPTYTKYDTGTSFQSILWCWYLTLLLWRGMLQ